MTEQMMIDLLRQVQRLERKVEGLVFPEVPRWQDWTPTVEQDGSVSVTVNQARYIVVGNMVRIEGQVTATSAGGSAAIITIGSLPFDVANNGLRATFGTAIVEDDSAGTFQTAFMQANLSTEFRLFYTASGGVAPGFILASGDIIGFEATYEAA